MTQHEKLLVKRNKDNEIVCVYDMVERHRVAFKVVEMSDEDLQAMDRDEQPIPHEQ